MVGLLQTRQEPADRISCQNVAWVKNARCSRISNAFSWPWNLVCLPLKGEPMWSGHGRRPNSRVHEITGKPEQNSQILFVVHILGCFGNVMSMGWPPLHTLFSLRGGLFGDPMPTYIWTPAEENRRMECRQNHTHLVPKATKNINYEQKFRISFRFSSYLLNSGIWATPMARPLRF